MLQKKKNVKTRYSKATPLGARSIRTAPVQRAQVKPAVRERAPAGKKRPATPTPRPPLPAPRADVRQRRAVLQFFRHTLTRSATVFVLFILFTATFVSRAGTDLQTFRATPTTCTGWNAADNVKVIDAPADAGSDAIPAASSATIQSRTAAQPASGDPQLKCKSFTLPGDFPSDVAIRSAQLLVSLAVQGNPDSEDVLVLESSFDGQQWNTLDSFFLTEDLSNATHGGYWTYPFAKLEPDAIGTLQVRARFVSVPSDKQVSVRVDGMALDVGVRQQVTMDDLHLPTGAVTVEKTQLKVSESPVVDVQVSQPSRLKFLGVKDTVRTVEDVQVTDPDGKVTAATYDISNVQTSKGTVSKVAITSDAFTKPGKYTTALTVVEGNQQAIVTSEFLWGVLVMNMGKSVYWPGETVDFGMGVLDADGHTVCDAKLTLRIVAPDGTATVLTTEQAKGVVRSKTCGVDNVTDVADYNATYDTFDQGAYAVTLTAKTSQGEYTIADTVRVESVVPIAIGRRGSMRIYPPAGYTMLLDVRPQRRYQGTVEEYLPPSFKVLTVSDGGKVIKGQQRTTIRWQVDIADHTLKTLTYRYDAPDISPELFRLGPLQVGDVQEGRQWQIASDALSGAPRLVKVNSDAAAKNIRMPKLEYAPRETPSITVEVDTRANIPLLQKRNERTVTAIELVDPMQVVSATALRAVASTDPKWETYTADPKTFTKPGKYTVRVHVTEDGQETVYTQDFLWGVLAVNPDKSWYKPGDDAFFSIGVLDETGDIVCDANVE